MANDTRGVFRLRTLRRENVEGDGVPLDDVWVSPSYGVPFAYLAGGRAPGSVYVSVVDKLSFGSDSVARSPSANLDIDRYLSNPVSSSTAAYWMTGQTPGPGSGWTNQTSKTTYTTDTTASSPNHPNVGPPYNSLGWESLGSTATETAGYVGGGMPTPMYSRTYLFKLDFSTDGFSSLPNFPQEQGQTGDALGNQTHGYWSGGIQKPSGSPNSYGAYTRVVRFTYATDTFSNVGTLPGPRKKVAASGNATEGYIYGGIDGHPSGTATWHSTAIKLTYSTDTTSLNPSNLSEYPRVETRASGNLSNGYVVGAGNPTTSSNISKFDYSTGTQSSPAGLKRSGTDSRGAGFASSKAYGHPGKFPIERWKDGAVEIKANHGYFGMGFPSSGNGDFKKLDFDTETVSPNYQFYSPGRQQFAVGSSLTHGYNLGGAYQGGAKSNVYKWDYATNSGSENPSKLNRTRRQSNSSSTRTHGYVVGGYSDFPTPDGTKTDISKYSFTTDTSLGNITGNLSTTNQAGMGAGNQEFGYHTQGSGTIIWKLTYSTDTVSTLTAQLPVYRYEMTPSTMANATTAYFVGGSQGPGAKSSTDKMDYSTDTLSVGSNLSNNAQRGQATSNTEVGYVMLGWNAPAEGGGSAVSQEVNKFDFATDTVTAKGGIFNHQPNTYSTALSIGMNNQSGLIPGPPEATPTPSIARQDHTYGIYKSSARTDFQKRDFTTGGTSVIPSVNSPGVAGSLVSDEVAIYSNDWNTAGKSVKMPWGSGTGASSPNTWSTSINPYFVGGEGPAPNMSSTKGYFTGGKNPSISPSPANGVSNRRQHIVFASGTGVSEGGKAQDYIWQAGSSDTATKGYMYGGFTAAWGGQNTISSMDFATDGSFGSVPGATLSYSRAEMAVVGNKETAYIAGTTYNQPGIPAQVSRFEKFTYATETNQSIPGLDTPYASNRSMAATGDQEKGYWAGSFDNPNAIVVTYSTETKSGTPNYPHPTSNSSPNAISQAQNAGSPGQIIVPISVL